MPTNSQNNPNFQRPIVVLQRKTHLNKPDEFYDANDNNKLYLYNDTISRILKKNGYEIHMLLIIQHVRNKISKMCSS